MLRALILTLLICVNLSVLGNDEDIEFARSLARTTKEHVRSGMKEKYQELRGLKERANRGEGDDEVLAQDQESDSVLRIFVSSSMSKNLLKSYYKEARRYKGHLVFNGLPSGSFKELTSLAQEIAGDEEIGGMEIDDEAFKEFGIEKVPSIVLSSKGDNSFGDEKTETRYDRISGAVSIRFALSEFASKGDLRLEARRILARSAR